MTKNFLLINPNDYHECVGVDEDSLDYSAIHISKKVMNTLVNEIFKSKDIAIFSKNVICELFTKEKGITPYKYLELYRINQPKRML